MVFQKIRPEFSTVTGKVTKETKEKINKLADIYNVTQADIIRVAVECIVGIDESVFAEATEAGVPLADFINQKIVGDE